MQLPDFQNLRDLRLGDRLREINLREWLNDNSAVTTIAAVVLLMVALGVMLVTVTGGGGGGGFEPPTQRFFYDLNTGELFPVAIDELPPIDRGEPFMLPNGQSIPAGVEAFVFGQEDGPADQYVIGWVETLHPDRRAELIEAQRSAMASEDPELAVNYQMLRDGEYNDRLVMDPNADEPAFFPRYSDQGRDITSRALERMAGRSLRPVFPD
ncbi:MAG: hypothetical protein AAF663_12030 [Planctomycetota bacterium]